MSPASIREENMNFKEVANFLNHEDNVTETVVSPDEITILTGLETLISKAYRFTRIFVKTPEDAMLRILWVLFYFVQQEHEITNDDEYVVGQALAAAKANAAFCKKDEESK